MLRRFVLRNVPSRVRMIARARDADGHEALRKLDVSDGIAACGWATVGMLRHLRDHRPPPGLHLPDALMRIDDVLSRLDGTPDTARPEIV